jgi:catechol-2,3-dioxygenase
LAGIVFMKTRRLAEVVRFYCERVGMTVWLEQSDCTILRHGNMLLGFCRRDEADTQGMVTFFYPLAADVDRMYREFSDVATTEPGVNEKYRIYHFFAHDPEGRAVEFQAFLDPVPEY